MGKRHPHVKPIKNTTSSLRVPKRLISKRRALTFHERRTKKAKETDEALEARLTRDAEKWQKSPNKWDIYGVDFYPSPTIRGDFKTNVKVLAYASEQYYNIDLSKLKIEGYRNEKAYDEAFGRKDASQSFYAFASGNTVAFSPKATRIIEKGKMETREDFHAMKTVSHEVGHIIGTTKPFTSSAFNEGSNEVLAVRFTLNSLQMNRDLRDKLRENPRPSYYWETSYAANIALLVNDGNEDKAIEWLKKFRSKNTPKTKKKEMRDKAETTLILKLFTSYETAKMEKEIDRLRGTADARWAEVERIRKKKEPMFKKLGWRGEKGGVLSPATTLPVESELAKYPHKRKLAQEFTRLRHREDLALQDVRIARMNANSIEKRMAKVSVFKKQFITRKDAEKTVKFIKLHYPETYKRSLSREQPSLAWWAY